MAGVKHLDLDQSFRQLTGIEGTSSRPVRRIVLVNTQS
jgi:hypothetical protein